MELAIVGRRLCEPLTGVGRYLEALLRCWAGAASPFGRVAVYTPEEPKVGRDLFQPPIELRIVPSRLPPLVWENAVLPGRIEPFDLLFAPYTLPWTLAGRGAVSNLGIYESRPEDFSWIERLRAKPFFRHSAQAAKAVLANSGSTRDDLVKFYGIDPEKIRVIYPGVDEIFHPGHHPAGLSEETARKLGIPPEPFFLFVGKLSRRRSVPLLLEAFRELKQRRKLAHSLVVVGPDTSGVDVPARASALSLGGSVTYIPYAGRETVAQLYRAATAFVLPTLHEGFSFTVLEAMASGTPAIVFDHAALEAGVRESAFLVEEPSAAALAEAMGRVADEPATAKELSKKGLGCASRFRWEETARQTAAELAACLSG